MYLKLAISSIRSARWRSLLTILGIVIGVVSVVTIISLGEGVKQQVSRQINQSGKDLITILPGQRVRRDQTGNIASYNPLASSSGTSFSDTEFKTLQQLPDIKPVVPFGKVVGLVKTNERSDAGAEVIATTEGLPLVLNEKLEFGAFFTDNEITGNSAMIGRRVAEQLYGEGAPLGKSLTIRDREFIVRGIFEEFDTTATFLPGTDYNHAVFIPYKTGQELMGGTMQLYQILAKPVDPAQLDSSINNLTQSLRQVRAGQEDFTVLKQHENLALTTGILDKLTNLITAIAAISLLVGGIGIMNIMLVSVTERTREIGIRKAVGATNRQILSQFMTEAAVLSLMGGIFGILLSVLTNYLLRIFTDLLPVITIPVMVAVGVGALLLGMVFGIAPALRAARKDPIEALRYYV